MSTSENKPIIWAVSVSRLFTLFRDISPEFSGQAEIIPLKQGFQDAVEDIRQRLKTEKCDAIVSAGSNGAYLKSHLSIPVITAKASGFDVLQALAQARQISDKIGIINYQKDFAALKEFQQSFGLQIVQRSYVTVEDARLQLNALKAMGIQVVIGAGLITDLAEEMGLTAILIYSTDTIRQAFNQAIEFTQIRYKRQDSDHLYPQNAAMKVRHTVNDLLGLSTAMIQVRQTVMLYARSGATVLIQGASGTGKELVAQAIHHEYSLFNQHKKKSGYSPFVAVNCGAIPENLLEAELFGYEEGAFTGARRGGRAGLFEAAHKGTLFLDEIGEMPLSLQTRLLRVLEDKSIVRIGGYKPINLDVRVICATHCDLDRWVEEGKFRADLFYRLGVLRVKLPALAEREGDILLLAEKLLKQAFASLDLSLPREYLQQMHSCHAYFYQYRWPGNVRELRNLMERVALYCSVYPDTVINDAMLNQLSPERDDKYKSVAMMAKPAEQQESASQLLIRFGGDKQAVANWLGISRTTLWRRLKQEKSHATGD